MKKHLLFGMFAAAGMLLATSCSHDELDGSHSGNEATVSISLGVENGVQTRAISDGKSADKLVYAVFDENGTRISGIQQVVKTGVTFPAKETLTLAKGQTYKVAFWAQDADCTAYTVSNDMQVSIDYTGVNNDETRDAFFKTETFTVNGNMDINVVLKRPFAQINVGVYQTDWDAAVASGIEIENSKVSITNAATSLNLLDGTVEGKQVVEYALNAIPTEALKVDLDQDGTKEDYKYLSMSYILVNPNAEGDATVVDGASKAILADLQYTFAPKAGNEISLGKEQGLANVPVQRNYRTNIIGQLLTGNVNFNISIDPIYDGEYNGLPFPIYVKTAEELIEAAKGPGKVIVILENDIVLKEGVTVLDGVELVVNANGKNVTYAPETDKSPWCMFRANGADAKITINADENSKFESLPSEEDNSGNMLVWAYGGHITINGGKWIGHDDNGQRNDCIYASWGENVGWGSIDICGGYYMIEEPGVDTWLFNCRWANSCSGQIQMYGGTIVGYDPNLGDEQTGPESNLPEGYEAVVTGTTDDGRKIFTVQPKA